ncbi:MAG: ComEC/Rec2 family competence protein [Bacteroidales bacterium]|nr:ComEC/Rec2 family competence protein [Bacteroidales bacterium]
MKEAVGIEGVSTAFAAGAATGAILFGRLSLAGSFWAGASIVGSLTFATMVLLLQRPRKPFTALFFFCCCGLTCYLTASISSPISTTDFFIRRIADNCSLAFKGLLDDMPFPHEECRAVVKALTTGDRTSLNPSTVTVFRKSGASHILALSGLHLGIIYMLITRITSVAGNAPTVRVSRYVLLVGLSGFYTLMSGASPSLVRAFLFILISETANLTGRQRRPLKVWCSALLVQLAADPTAIASTGFQLSYLAMLGIFTVFPHMQSWYPESRRFDPLKKIWDMAALSISCQLFTGPLAWLRFHAFPMYFLLTNLIVMPLTTLVMTSALSAMLLAAAGLEPVFLTRVTDSLTGAMLYCLEIIASM